MTDVGRVELHYIRLLRLMVCHFRMYRFTWRKNDKVAYRGDFLSQTVEYGAIITYSTRRAVSKFETRLVRRVIRTDSFTQWPAAEYMIVSFNQPKNCWTTRTLARVTNAA